MKKLGLVLHQQHLKDKRKIVITIKKIIKKPIKKLLKAITKNPKVISFLSGLIYMYVKFIGYTGKWETKGFERIHQNWNDDENMIFVGWHGRILMFPYFWNIDKQNLHAIVSQHQDGQLIAGVLRRFGIQRINGSSTNNAKGAALALMRAVNQGDSICIVPDGPIGPRMKMSISPIYYAQKTGRPLYGITYSSENAFIVKNSWDKMMLPLPFTKGIVSVTEPFYIPKDASDEQLEQYRLQLEESLNNLSFENDKYTNTDPIKPDLNQRTKKRRR